MQGPVGVPRARSASEPSRPINCSLLQSRFRIRHSELSYEQGKDIAAHSLGKWTSAEVSVRGNSKLRISAVNTCDVLSTVMQRTELLGISMFAQSTAVSLDGEHVTAIHIAS